MSGAVVGLDVGGAHLKLARLSAGGALEAVRIAPCALWRGLAELDGALQEVAADMPDDADVAITMTGELVDLWPDRAAGVAALVGALASRFGRRAQFYAGAHGFLDLSGAAAGWMHVASANWCATAQALAADHGDGLLVDVGSTTSDVVPFADGRVAARGSTDARRMAAEELVYLGVARTPVMALAPRMPFRGTWIAPMAELFATSADVFRLTGELPEGADLHPAADGCDKTDAGSARRLLRMVGADLGDAAPGEARALAAWLSGAALNRLCDAAAIVLSAPGAPEAPTVFGAGVGRFLARRLAGRLGLMYRDVGAEWSADPRIAAAAADCAPAVAVARLFAHGRKRPI